MVVVYPEVGEKILDPFFTTKESKEDQVSDYTTQKYLLKTITEKLDLFLTKTKEQPFMCLSRLPTPRIMVLQELKIKPYEKQIRNF